MRIFLAVIIFGLLTSAAYSQIPTSSGPRSGPPEVPKQKVDEQAYRDAVKRIPDKISSDPWGTVRASGADNNNQNKKPSGSK